MRLATARLTWAVDERRILDDVTLDVAPGEFVGLLGPNGSGKSSLLRCLYRYQRPTTGHELIDGQEVWSLRPQAVARLLAVVVQDTGVDLDFTVREIVAMGRTPHKRLLERDDQRDEHAVTEALATVGAHELAGRLFRTLSGGERQRVLLARAITQQPQALILDEPTNHLDVRYQLELLTLVRELGVTTLAAMHDLNLAAAFCDRLVVLDRGRVAAAGNPDEVLTPDRIAETYGVKAEVSLHPVSGRLTIVYLPAVASRDRR